MEANPIRIIEYFDATKQNIFHDISPTALVPRMSGLSALEILIRQNFRMAAIDLKGNSQERPALYSSQW